MKKLLLSLLFIVSACASVPVEDPLVQPVNAVYSEEFGSYLRLFKLEGAKRGFDFALPYNLKIYFVDGFADQEESAKDAGLCHRMGDKKIIYLNKPYWDASSTLEREMTIFHELGHCVFGYDHDETTNEDGLPQSIMYPSAFSDNAYHKNREKYLDAFFAPIIQYFNSKKEKVAPILKRGAKIKLHKCHLMRHEEKK